MAPAGPLGPAKGTFWVILGHFGAQVLAKPTIVPYCSLYGQFLCYAGWILDNFRSFGCFGGPVEHFWRPIAAFGALFLDLLATSWAYPEPFLDLLATIWAYFGGKVPPTTQDPPVGGSRGTQVGSKCPKTQIWTLWRVYL